MYKNGVMLQGGSFHSLDDPNTKAILDAISQGQVHPALFSPEEAEQARSKPLEIVLEDQRTQDYIAPFSEQLNDFCIFQVLYFYMYLCRFLRLEWWSGGKHAWEERNNCLECILLGKHSN